MICTQTLLETYLLLVLRNGWKAKMHNRSWSVVCIWHETFADIVMMHCQKTEQCSEGVCFCFH